MCLRSLIYNYFECFVFSLRFTQKNGQCVQKIRDFLLQDVQEKKTHYSDARILTSVSIHKFKKPLISEGIFLRWWAFLKIIHAFPLSQRTVFWRQVAHSHLSIIKLYYFKYFLDHCSWKEIGKDSKIAYFCYKLLGFWINFILPYLQKLQYFIYHFI